MEFGKLNLEKGIEVVLQGTIVFLAANDGSKSEGVYPHLYQDRETKIKIFKEGDNPFENHGFDDFDGKQVELKGSLGRGNIFVVKEIKAI